MVSRKKAKGKARRAAKQEQAKEEASDAVAAAEANQQQGEPLEAQMERLQINSTAINCSHGLDSLSPSDAQICLDFINAFITVYNTGGDKLGRQLGRACKATAETYYGSIIRQALQIRRDVASLYLCMIMEITGQRRGGDESSLTVLSLSLSFYVVRGVFI